MYIHTSIDLLYNNLVRNVLNYYKKKKGYKLLTRRNALRAQNTDPAVC